MCTINEFSKNSRDGIPGLVSGELCFVSHPSSGDILPPKIKSWLKKSRQKSDLKEKLKHIQKSKEYILTSNKKRKDFYQLLQKEGPLLCELISRGVSDISQQSVTHLTKALKNLDYRLIELTLKYALITDAERQVAMSQLLFQAQSCILEKKQQLYVQHFTLFSLHLEHETDNSLSLKRLPHAHPQFQRCKRAATENIKEKLFKTKIFSSSSSSTSSSYYSGINVQEVYKIENKTLLNNFQNQSLPHLWENKTEEDKKECLKIKGLFCRVPRSCIERVIVYGAHSKQPTDSFHQIFKKKWLPIQQQQQQSGNHHSDHHHHHSNGNGVEMGRGEGYASKLVQDGTSLRFPRSFSRYSTLEEDVDFLTKNNQNIKNEEGEGGGGGNEIMFLALCRVLMGNVNRTENGHNNVKGNKMSGGGVTSNDKNNDGDGNDDNGYDAIYSQSKEEYTLFRPEFVLPEFLIQFNYIPSSENRTKENDNIKNNENENDKINDKINPSLPPPPISLLSSHISLPRHFAYDDEVLSSSSSLRYRKPSSPCPPSKSFVSSMGQNSGSSNNNTNNNDDDDDDDNKDKRGLEPKTMSPPPLPADVIFQDGVLLSEREALNLIANEKVKSSTSITTSPSRYKVSTSSSPSPSSSSSSSPLKKTSSKTSSESLNERLNGQLQRKSIGGAIERSFELFWQKRDLIQKEELMALRKKMTPFRLRNKHHSHLYQNSTNHQRYRINQHAGGDINKERDCQQQQQQQHFHYSKNIFKIDPEPIVVEETQYAAAGRRSFMMRHGAGGGGGSGDRGRGEHREGVGRKTQAMQDGHAGSGKSASKSGGTVYSQKVNRHRRPSRQKLEEE